MSYNIIPNIIFIISVLGVILIILKHLPEATAADNAGKQLAMPEQRLLDKGLPIVFASKLKIWVIFWGKRAWHFVLEAKGIKHQAQVGYRIKQLFKKKPSDKPTVENVFKPMDITTSITKDEAFYLHAIKENPKDLANYGGLAQVYLDSKNYREAKDIYEYLVKHDAGNANFYAKLGYVSYILENFENSVKAYENSLSLDSSHPNRYYNLGLAKRALGDQEAAHEAFSKALALDPQNQKYKDAVEEAKVK